MSTAAAPASRIDHGGRESESRALTLLWLLLPTVALLLAVSHESAWIDEAFTGWVARQPTLQTWWLELAKEKGSALQMPLYMLYIWAFEKLFGASELALRLAGLPWLASGVAVFVWAFRSRRERLVAALVVATSAFAWYYSSEARPYSMQLGASCAVVGVLHRLTDRDGLTARQESALLGIFGMGLVVLCGSSMLGMFWAAAALAGAWVLWSSAQLLTYWRQHRAGVAAVTAILLVIGLYYLWTLTVGARASAAARTDLQTIAFIFYEQLGFSGLGPGRTDMREAGIRALLPYAPALLGYGLMLAAVMGAALLAILKSDRLGRTAMLAAVTAAPAVLLIAAGFVTHFRLLGRHWAPLMPVWFTLLMIGVIALWQRPRVIGKAVVAGFFVLSLWSCLALRFAPRHARDDYRQAAASARVALAGKQTVWWNAAEVGAAFYDVPLTSTMADAGKAVLVVSPDASGMAALGSPDVIIASKPDLYDSTGAVASYIANRRFRPAARFAAFTVWRAGEVGPTGAHRPASRLVPAPPLAGGSAAAGQVAVGSPRATSAARQ